jgi:hypothetical protein
MADYLAQFKGSFKSTMHWHDLDTLWNVLKNQPENWYVYAVGEAVPTEVLSADGFTHFIQEMDALLRAEHDEDYCGIVYADNLQQPGMVKIYDPNNLGVSCGYSETPPLPGWVLSRIPPVDLQATQALPKNRQRWWRRLLG